MEMPEGWKKLAKSFKTPEHSHELAAQIFAMDLMKEMAEAMQGCIDAMNGSSAPDSYGVQDLEEPLQKFKDWK